VARVWKGAGRSATVSRAAGGERIHHGDRPGWPVLPAGEIIAITSTATGNVLDAGHEHPPKQREDMQTAGATAAANGISGLIFRVNVLLLRGGGRAQHHRASRGSGNA
jgi:hypothetical protein